MPIHREYTSAPIKYLFFFIEVFRFQGLLIVEGFICMRVGKVVGISIHAVLCGKVTGA